MDQTEALARIFKVLSVETRVRIVQILKDRALCVNALARHLGITPAAVSQHLRFMREAGIVTPQKRGYFVHYALDAERLARWREQAAGFLEPRTEPEGGTSCAAKGMKRRRRAGSRRT